MRTKQLFLILALLCTMVQGAWAQASWDEVYAMTNTTSANWTALTEGSTTGKTIGTANTTTYYYADANLTFSNSTAGGSALTILGTVYLYLPQGVTVTCTGADASGQTGAGAGIELALGNALILLGKGTVNATGGNAANGSNGANGKDASYDSNEGAAWVGGGGTGGNGGGGAGAGIGTRGGTGGAGGSAPESEIYYKTWVENGVAGSTGSAGLTADTMGSLYVSNGITVNVTGGSKGAAGTAGSAGKSYLLVGSSYDYSFPGGGGGGAGGFGGAASGIGSGGAGGGGGGGGAKGSHTWASYGFFQVYAKGGDGGQNADGSFAAGGATAGVSKANVENGLCATNDANWVKTAEERTGGDVTTTINGGSGSTAGSASTSESAHVISFKKPAQGELDMACQQTNTSQSDWTMLPFGTNIGTTLGTPGTTTYYFTTGDRSFTNVNAGGSGLTIQGMVYLYVPEGLTVTCKGADASGATGAGAGIELTQENALTLLGGGTVNATGGNAANGSDGLDGSDANWNDNNFWSGPGGAGGDGGGGAGGFGGAAANIGSGGPGGGGGGSGASSNIKSGHPGYWVVRAPGGKGGQNVDGTWNAEGAESILNYQAITNGQVNSNSSGWDNYDSNVCNQAVGSGGNGGATGQACTSGQVVNVTVKLPEQSEWDMVCQQTKTSQSQWCLLPQGNIMGTTIGTAGSDSYYYATGDRTFANANAGGSGLTILGTVHLFIASGQTITCTGADASGATGGGAGVELTEGNTLCLIGSGKIVATGGQAANGCNGFKGGDAAYKVAKSVYDSNGLKSGDGGRGGDGGGGAGAGIGTRGADGGAGGAGGVGKQGKEEVTGDVGSNGVGGGTAADMGTLYVYQMAEPTIEAHGGSSGSSGGNGGAAGLNAVFQPLATGSFIDMSISLIKKRHDGSSGTSRSGGFVRMGDTYSVGGGGGAASDIGSGGPGGGGGGGGASGSVTYVYTTTSGLSYYQVGALGGKGGANADGTAAADGEETMINSEKTNVVFEKDDYKDYTFLGWYNGIDNRAAGGEGANPGPAARSGTYEVMPAVISLADNADNRTTISDAHGYLADVTLQDRTLYKDGAWNTLCLPFDVTIAGSPLAGATARPLTSASISGSTLTLTFDDAVTTLKAGTPYIIKWTKPDPYVAYDGTNADGTSDIVSPVFSGVTIDADADGNYDTETASPAVTTDERVRFLGTYKSTTFDAEDKSILLVGGGNALYYPTAGAGIGAQRAYFKIGSDGALLARRLTAFNIDFGDDEATGIISIENGKLKIENDADTWYSLDGRKLSGKPSVKGVYVNNGRKVIIK